MSDREFWLYFSIALFACIAICRVAYYKYESKRQSDIAKSGFNPNEESKDDE